MEDVAKGNKKMYDVYLYRVRLTKVANKKCSIPDFGSFHMLQQNVLDQQYIQAANQSLQMSTRTQLKTIIIQTRGFLHCHNLQDILRNTEFTSRLKQKQGINNTNTSMPKRKFVVIRIYTTTKSTYHHIPTDQPLKVHSQLEFYSTFLVKMQSLYELPVHKLCVYYFH